MGKGFSEAERQIVTALIETKAVDFQALGNALAKHGANATFELDGEDWFCGTMRGFVRVMRLTGGVTNQVEDLAKLTALGRGLQE